MTNTAGDKLGLGTTLATNRGKAVVWEQGGPKPFAWQASAGVTPNEQQALLRACSALNLYGIKGCEAAVALLAKSGLEHVHELKTTEEVFEYAAGPVLVRGEQPRRPAEK